MFNKSFLERVEKEKIFNDFNIEKGYDNGMIKHALRTNFFQAVPGFYEENYLDEGATKVVVINKYHDEVIKIPTPMGDNDWGDCKLVGASYTDDGWNYCEQEVMVYELACSYNLGKYFAPIRYIKTIDEVMFYAQSKCEFDKQDFTFSAESYKTGERVNYEFNSEEWVAEFIEFYGEQEFHRLQNFIENIAEINDMHCGNLGYLDGAPVLVDYSGYWE